MPVQSNGFSDFADRADRARHEALRAMGLACLEVVQPDCPVGQYPRGSGKVGGNLKNSHTFAVEADHVDVGPTADYGFYVHNGTSGRRANPWIVRNVSAERAYIRRRGEDRLSEVLGE